MPAKPMLDDVELQQVQEVEAEDQEVLTQHGVPALEGDFLQDLGRRATRVKLTGVLTGSEAGDGLKKLREKFRAAEPVPLVADIATATKTDKVLIEEMGVRELAGKPERFEYAFTLLEFTPPPKPKEEPPPPPPTPPPPPVDSGKLVVEVKVEGQPGFDFSKVTLTLEETQEDKTPLTRTLTSRKDNVWTEEKVPPGQYTVKAAGTNPQAMTGSAEAAVRAGQTVQVTITLKPGAIIAKAFIVHFRFDSAFVEPCMRGVLRQAADHAKAHASEKLLIVGHTDQVGSPQPITGPDLYNQSLSERRARSVFAYLTSGRTADASVAEWDRLRQKQTEAERKGQRATLADNWGTRQFQFMLQDLAFYPGRVDGKDGPLFQEAVRAFRCKNGLPPGTTVDDATFDKLVRTYMGQDSLAVPESHFFRNAKDGCDGGILKWLGCASQDPVKNTRAAFRPNRRVELLFVQADKLPCEVPQPDTFDLPAPGAVGSTWCLGPGEKSKRSCFITLAADPKAKPKNGQLTREPVPTIALQGSILFEDGKPYANKKFVLIASNGEFKAGEQSNGEAQPALTDKEGKFKFPDKPVGVCSLEVLDDVVVRLEEEKDSDAKGNAVCKVLKSGNDQLDVKILIAPVLRQIRLPVVAHLMTALEPRGIPRSIRTCPRLGEPGGRSPQATTLAQAKDENTVALFEGATAIWRQARIRFELEKDNIVRETYSFRTECEVDRAEFESLLGRCAYPNAVNVFFLANLTDPGGDPGGIGFDIEHHFPLAGCAVADRTRLPGVDPPVNKFLTQDEMILVLAHELGHFLNLEHVKDAGRLMRDTEAAENRTLVRSEANRARASRGAALECIPLSLRVTGPGVKQIGGTLSHEFIVIEKAGTVVTVDALISDALLDPAVGTLAMTGPGANPKQRTVSAAVSGPPVEIVATYTPAGGGDVITTRVAIHVATFTLRVEGAARVPGTDTFLATGDPTAVVTVIADVNPVPFCVPEGLIAWTRGDQIPDPQARTVSRANAASTTVSATVAGTTKSVTIKVVFIELTETATAAAPAISFVRFGLWDHAFRADGTVFNEEAESDNFAGADSRKSHIRVRDQSARGKGNIPVNWRTLDQNNNNMDAPPIQTITLVEDSGNPGVFISRGLILVTDKDDQDQVTHSGLAAPLPDAGLRRKKDESNHRVRRASLLGSMVVEYPIGSSALITQFPIFQRNPEERRRLPLQIFVLRVAPGGAGVVPTAPGSALWTTDLRVIRETYERIGIQVETVVGPGTPAASIVTVGGDSIALIDPPAGVNPANITFADETTLGTTHPALADTIRVFFAGGLSSGFRGETWDDGIAPVGNPRRGASFISQGIRTPYTVSHETGHSLTNKQANNGHYNAPTVPAANRLHNNQNLMRAVTAAAESVSATKRLWDAVDADGVNQFTAIRGSHYTGNL